MNILFTRLQDIEVLFFACYDEFASKEGRFKVYKLLLLDIDGTLKDEKLGIPDSAKKAIQLCQNNGCHVVICTGRSIGTIQAEVLSLNVDGYIAGGGSYIQYHDKVIQNESFHQAHLKMVIDFLKKEDVAFTIESQEMVFMNQKAKDILETMNDLKGINRNILNQLIQEKIQYTNNINQFDNQSIHKICLWSKQEVYETVKSILNNQSTLAQSDTYQDMQYYEIIQNGFHKGNAIKRLQNELHISKNETICFGDGLNDIEMFKQSSKAIAMKRSHPKLIEVATSVCEDIFNDGIYKELKRQNII